MVAATVQYQHIAENPCAVKLTDAANIPITILTCLKPMKLQTTPVTAAIIPGIVNIPLGAIANMIAAVRKKRGVTPLLIRPAIGAASFKRVRLALR